MCIIPQLIFLNFTEVQKSVLQNYIFINNVKTISWHVAPKSTYMGGKPFLHKEMVMVPSLFCKVY